MATFANSLKHEIARIARKELKGELTTLRKNAAAHRSEIAALKRAVKSLTSANKALMRQAKTSMPAVTLPPSAAGDLRRKPGRQVVYSAERLAAIKEKLGLTQAQLAKLLGVSGLLPVPLTPT